MHEDFAPADGRPGERKRDRGCRAAGVGGGEAADGGRGRAGAADHRAGPRVRAGLRLCPAPGAALVLLLPQP
jgi:hypothetical protein